MKLNFTFCVVLIFLNSILQAQVSKTIPMVVWAGIPKAEINEYRFNELKQMGASIAIAQYENIADFEKALTLAQNTGLKLIASCPELKTNPEATTKQLKNHPALYGYYIQDEPLRKDFDELGVWVKKIKASDPAHMCFVNLIASIHPTYTKALGTNSYQEYIQEFAKIVPQDVLSFDFYPILTDAIHENWYEGLGIFSKEAASLKKPFWGFALASSYNDLHPIPTIPALRLQAYSNLAYGAQGIELWAYWMSEGLRSAPISLDGKRTVVYERIQALSKEMQPYAAVFMGAKLISVNHTGVVIPKGTTQLMKLPDAIKVFDADEALVSTLENGGYSYFIVVNKNLHHSMPTVILTEEGVERIAKDGTASLAKNYSPNLEIEPGDVAIFRYPTKK
jgi:hypothetical protein